MKHTEQIKAWNNDFGRRYTDRNPQNPDKMDALYMRNFRTSRSRLNKDFLSELDRTFRILEVGTNIAVQLQLIQKIGFQNLYGIEPQTYALQKAKQLTRNINLIQGNTNDY